jgi:hypothetical protein
LERSEDAEKLVLSCQWKWAGAELDGDQTAPPELLPELAPLELEPLALEPLEPLETPLEALEPDPLEPAGAAPLELLEPDPLEPAVREPLPFELDPLEPAASEPLDPPGPDPLEPAAGEPLEPPGPDPLDPPPSGPGGADEQAVQQQDRAATTASEGDHRPDRRPVTACDEKIMRMARHR